MDAFIYTSYTFLFHFSTETIDSWMASRLSDLQYVTTLTVLYTTV